MSNTPEEAVSQAGAETAPPDEAAELRKEIEQTRERLGDTVEQLAAKADVKAQAKAKATELADAVRSKVALAGASTPESVRQAVTRAVRTVRQRPIPVAAAVGVVLLGCLMRPWRKRR
jgi:ElaB/YqjD/DUF883 family membrane-anchored ribosome-binding protein